MHQGKLVFSQLMAHLPLSTFRRCVAAHRGEHKVKDFSCLDQFLAMAFAQLTWRESLRDIEVNLRARPRQLYHMGFRCQTISRNTLANANATRPWQMYADFAQHLIALARPLYASEPLAVDLDATVYAFDATTIDLCLSLHPWAPFRSTKAAVKLHTLLDLRGSIPSFIHISDGKTHEVNVLDELLIEPGAFYLLDRGYLDFSRLFAIHQAQAFFVTRAKRNTQFKRRYSHPVDRLNTAVLCDQTGALTVFYSSKDYPAVLRRVVVKDDAGKRITFLTNNFSLQPELIAALYRQRWQVELFFKWIKQHLRIKAFLGTSKNAVKTQIWIEVPMSSGIRSAALSDYAGVARSVGLDPVAMVQAAKLPVSSLESRDLMLPTERVCDLLEASAQLSGCATFGLALAQHRRLSHLGELGLLLRDLPTVRDVMQATSEYVRFHNESLVYALEAVGTSTHILMENRLPSGTLSRQFSEFVQGSAYRIFLGQFAAAQGKLRACFRHSAPVDLRRHQEFFGHAPVFDHDFSGFICPQSLMDQRNPSADTEFSLYARSLVEAKVVVNSTRRSDDVLRVIMQLLPTGRCDAEHIAERLGVDRRTVHRQLVREGTTISDLIDQIRAELSARYVLESSAPISDLAPMLGFHTTSALVNWYRRRFGVPPAQHRRNPGGDTSTV